MNSCESCGSEEDLIESGGQFCGGDWWICQSCDDKAKRFSKFMESDDFKELVSKHSVNKGKYVHV